MGFNSGFKGLNNFFNPLETEVHFNNIQNTQWLPHTILHCQDQPVNYSLRKYSLFVGRILRNTHPYCVSGTQSS